MTAVLAPRSIGLGPGTLGRLPCDSLLFEVELDGSQPSTSGAALGDRVRAANVAERVRYLTSTKTLFESRLLRDVRVFQSAILREEGKPDAVVLASKLAAVGYKLVIRTAVGGGSGRSCFHNLHHEFLLVSGDPEFGSPQDKEYIIDPSFRDQFIIPQMTPAYEELMRLLPAEFVGTPSRLVPLVQLLCEEMCAAFDAHNMTCPPWRQAKSMLSKWLPTKRHDKGVNSPKGGGSDRWGDTISSGVSPISPLDSYWPTANIGTSPPDMSAKSPARSPAGSTVSIPWWDKSTAAVKGSSEEGMSPGNSPSSSVKLERSTSLLSRNLASKASGEKSLPQQAVTAENLAAKLQKATIDQFLSDEHPPIRRVKMVGARATAKVA